MNAKLPATAPNWIDPDDAPELTAEDLAKGIWRIGEREVAQEIGMAEMRQSLRPGRPEPGARKILLSVRYSPEVVAYFRASGEGWQARMDEALKDWIKAHGASAATSAAHR